MAVTPEEKNSSSPIAPWNEAHWRTCLDEMRQTACALEWLGEKGLHWQFTMVRIFEVLSEWPELDVRATYGSRWIRLTLHAGMMTLTVNCSTHTKQWEIVGPDWVYRGYYPERKLRKWLHIFEQFRSERVMDPRAFINLI